MKFLINENSNLVIVDDKKETIIHTDRYELMELMRAIQDFLLGVDVKEEEKKENKYVYRFNPRSRRLEKTIK